MECTATYFSGSISFSQISSQATNLLLDSHHDNIKYDYVTSLELSHRLNGDNTLIDSLSVFLNETSYLASVLTTFANTSFSLQQGYHAFYYQQTAAHDFSTLQKSISNFISAYNDLCRSRQLAMRYVSQAISQLVNLDNLMRTAPNSYDSYFRAQMFYTTMWTELTLAETNMQLSTEYLALVISDEMNGQYRHKYLPSSFYVSSSVTDTCRSLYRQTSQAFILLSPKLAYVRQKISLWLQDHNESIFNSTIDSLFQNQFAAASVSSSVPGLWALLQCDELNCANLANYSSWAEILAAYTESRGTELMGDCLSLYEITLQKFYNTAVLPALATPMWYLNDMLIIPLIDLQINTEKANVIIHTYLTGARSEQEAIAHLNDCLQSMTVILKKIENTVLMSAIDWNNDVIEWRDHIIFQYMTLVDGFISLAKFMPNNAALINTISNMFIWSRPNVQLNVFSLNNPDLRVIGNISTNLLNYFQHNASSFIREAVIAAIEFNLAYAQQHCDELRLMLTKWYGQRDNISNIVSQYSQQFLVGDSFIK